jgi:hypothetical protein
MGAAGTIQQFAAQLEREGESDAQQAFSAATCSGLFGATTLSNLVSDVIIQYNPLNDPGTFAQTWFPGDNDNPVPGRYVIDVNTDPLSPFLINGAISAADTIIHELLHVAVDKGYGAIAVGLGWVQEDGGIAAAEARNQSIISTYCFH